MWMLRTIGWSALACCVGVTAYGSAGSSAEEPTDCNPWVFSSGPIAEPRLEARAEALTPETPRGLKPAAQELLPSGISQLPVSLNGERAYSFKDEDGTDALHFIGEFVLTLGHDVDRFKTGTAEGHTALEARSHEAVIWIDNRHWEDRPYRQLQILLWEDARIHEVAGTVTSGPVLFVTLNTFGEIAAHMDSVAFESSADSQVYREGNAIRKAYLSAREGAADLLRGSDQSVHLRVFDASALTEGKKKEEPKPPPRIHIRSGGDLVTSEMEDGRRVVTVTGGVYLSRGMREGGEYQEIRADSAVVFLPKAHGSQSVGYQPEAQTGFGELEVEAAYLEGDVVMSQGPNMIRASRLYYDFLQDRALILDAVVRTMIVERDIPLYLRAAKIRQLSRKQFAATDARLTTSEFYTPHYHVGASRVELVDLTPADPTGRQRGIRAGSFIIHHATLNLGGRPIAYWPYIRGNIDTSETAIKSVRSGFSDDFGLELETKWHLFNVAGLETPDGFDATLSLDYFSRRGPAAGVDAKYERDTYFGLLRSYFLADGGKDFLGHQREELSERDLRGRFLLRHRHYLADDWQVSLELSYISDRGFLEEFFESEFDNEKEQETLLYLKKQRENRVFTALVQPRILDFTTQTERLPDLTYHVLGEPLPLPGGRPEQATWFSENRLGYIRFRPVDQTIWELLRRGRTPGSGSVARADSRQEVGLPIDLGPVRLVPFVSVRGTGWDDSPEDGGVARVFGTYGVRGGMYLSRVYPEVRSSLFDIDGIRHIIKPDIVAWVSHTNRDSRELFAFDELVEGIDEVDGVTLGVRQRWQTRRGPGMANPECGMRNAECGSHNSQFRIHNSRFVDFLTLDVELGLFSDAPGTGAGLIPREISNGYTSYSRPENSISQNYVNSSLIWRVSDRTALLSELNYDLNDGEIDILNLSLAVQRSPRFSYLLGYRFIEESNSNLLGFDMNYRLTEKHTLAVRELFDLARGRTLDFTVAFIRKFPRWFGAVSFALDEPEDDFGVSLSVWPEGLPPTPGGGLGSRRFTGLPRMNGGAPSTAQQRVGD